MKLSHCALLAALLVTAPAFARDIKDASGVQVHLTDKPVRIITLMPSLGELAAEVLGNDLTRIVGVSTFTNYPPALEKKPKVDSYAKPNAEAVLELKPDLVLASLDGNPPDQVSRLRELGAPIVTIKTDNLADIEESIRLVGISCGVPESGQKIARAFHARLNTIQKRAEERSKKAVTKKPRVLVIVESTPLIVAGGTSFLHDTLQIIGATNIYGDLSVGYPKPTLEDVLYRNPDVILILAQDPSQTKAAEKALVDSWNRFPSLNAVKNKKIYVIKDDAIVRPTSRLLNGLEQIEVLIYGK